MADYLTPEAAERIRYNLSVQPPALRRALLASLMQARRDAAGGPMDCPMWTILAELSEIAAASLAPRRAGEG